VVVGIWLSSPSAALIVAGVVLVALTVLYERGMRT
jgi:hypothetical protein